MFEYCKLQKVIDVDDDDREIGTHYELIEKETGLKLVQAPTMKKLKQRVQAIEIILTRVWAERKER